MNSKMTIKFQDESCVVTRTWKAYSLLKRHSKTKIN